jgi:hypothetical protein
MEQHPMQQGEEHARIITEFVIGMILSTKNTEIIKTMKKLYQTVSLYKQSFFQKIFRQYPEENSVIEINNLLAQKPVKSITSDEIAKISKRYDINIYHVFKKNIFEFYAVYLNDCLKNKNLSDDDNDELKHLKTLLRLSNDDTRIIHDKLAGAIYEESVQDAIEDGRLDNAKIESLEKLQKQLRLSENITKKIFNDTRSKFLSDYLKNIVSSQRFSPEDEKEYQTTAKSLMVDVTMDKETEATLDKFKQYWAIENKDLNPLEVDINLQKSENCYFTTFVEWHEKRAVPRAGYDEWRFLDQGQLYLTNKRIVFSGSKKTTNVRLDKILSFVIYSDGIEIKKDVGRNPLLRLRKDIDIFNILLSRLLKEL